MKLLLKICLSITLFIAVERICHKQTHGFRLHKIYSNLPYNPIWETAPLTHREQDKIRAILSQPFYFLNSGGESYAFISRDHQYVLKFFKHHHMRPRHWLDPILPKSVLNNRLMRLNRYFTSCTLAYDCFRKETGLVFVHLNKTKDLNVQLKFYGPLGISYKVNLDELEFALQKKASMAEPTIAALAEAREFDAAKVRLSSLVDLIVDRCKAGLADHDAQMRNFGFIGEEAIEIDLGSFSINESLKSSQGTKRTLLQETHKLRHWIKKEYPELSPFLEKKIKEELNIELPENS